MATAQSPLKTPARLLAALEALTFNLRVQNHFEDLTGAPVAASRRATADRVLDCYNHARRYRDVHSGCPPLPSIPEMIGRNERAAVEALKDWCRSAVRVTSRHAKGSAPKGHSRKKKTPDEEKRAHRAIADACKALPEDATQADVIEAATKLNGGCRRGIEKTVVASHPERRKMLAGRKRPDITTGTAVTQATLGHRAASNQSRLVDAERFARCFEREVRRLVAGGQKAEDAKRTATDLARRMGRTEFCELSEMVPA